MRKFPHFKILRGLNEFADFFERDDESFHKMKSQNLDQKPFLSLIFLFCNSFLEIFQFSDKFWQNTFEFGNSLKKVSS